MAAAPPTRIPLTRRQLVDRLLAEAGALDAESEARLRAVLDLVQATLHFDLHARLEAMKAAYAPFDPDADDPPDPSSSEDVLTEAAHALGDELAGVLEKAGYATVSNEDIDRAFEEQALFPIRLVVDFDLYEELLVYARGRRERQVEVRRWFRRKRTQTFESFDRVCLYVRFKSDSGLKARLPYPPGSTILKLFRNIPVADLEILFPGCEVRLRLRDKLLLGVPALVGGVPVLIKLGPALLALGVLVGLSRERVSSASIVAGLTGLVLLGGYLGQQWGKLRSRRVRFMKILSENLYFRNLDNNEGVLTRLVDEAEEELGKEAMLAWVLALRAAQPVTRAELASAAEDWLRSATASAAGFRSEGAIAEALRLGLLREAEGGVAAVDPETAMAELDRRWDALFEPFRPALTPVPEATPAAGDGATTSADPAPETTPRHPLTR